MNTTHYQSADTSLARDLFDPAVRADLLMDHPLIASNTALDTNPLLEVLEAGQEAVLLRTAGCCFAAPSGTGKTFAMRRLEERLRAVWPSLYIVSHRAHNRQAASIRAFFMHYLSTVRHPVRNGETQMLRQRLENTMIDAALQSGLNIVVLLIDEAQAMKIDDFRYLKDLVNELEHNNVRLIPILMGQYPEMQDVVDKVKKEKHLDIFGRFLIRIRPFRPLQTITDITEVLKLIDAAIYPKDSGWTWTQFFFPQAYDHGFRMADQANSLYDICMEHSSLRGKEIVLPARQLFTAIRTFMYRNSVYDASTLALPPTAWGDALKEAELQEAILIATPQHRASQLEVTL